MKLLKISSLILSASAIVSCSNGTSNNTEAPATTENTQEEIVAETIDSLEEEEEEEIDSTDIVLKKYTETIRQRLISEQHKVEGAPNIKSFVFSLLPSVDGYYKEPDALKGMEKNFDMENEYFESIEKGDGLFSLTSCYWERKDGKKLVAFHSIDREPNRKEDTTYYIQNSYLLFYLYNEENQELEHIEAPFDKPLAEEHLECILPQEGQDIQYSYWEGGQAKKDLHILKWNGMGFDVQ